MERSIPFTLSVHAEFAKPAPEGGRAQYIPVTAMAIETMVARMFGDTEPTRRALMRHIQRLSDENPEMEGGPEEDAPPDLDVVLWELSERTGLHAAFVVDAVAEPLRAALEGRFQPFGLGFWSPQRGPFHGLAFTCEGVEFEDGSLKSILKGCMHPVTVVLLSSGILAAALSPACGDAWKDFQIAQRIEAQYGTEPCFTETRLEIDGAAVRDAAANDLNFKEHGLSPVEQARRVCLVQMALSLNGYPVGKIDGRNTKKLQHSLHAFAAKHKVSGQIGDPDTQRALAAALFEATAKLAR